MRGTVVCRLHGGASIAATVIANTKTGLYSTALRRNPELAARVEALKADPGLLDLTEDIAWSRALMERHIDAYGEMLAGGNTLQQHFQILDTLGKQIERHHRIRYDEQHLVNEQSQVAFVAALAEGLGSIVQEFVIEDRQEDARQAVRALVARLSGLK